MRSSSEDEWKGNKDRMKGNMKEGMGKLLGDRELEREGKDDKFFGKMRKKWGEIKKVFNH
ncbi:MAG: CsbD family protein [Syntrophobacteraceae bacterium]